MMRLCIVIILLCQMSTGLHAGGDVWHSVEGPTAGSVAAADGMSWSVDFSKDWPAPSRTRRVLPLDVYKGAKDPVLTITLDGSQSQRPTLHREPWGCLRATYPLENGTATVAVNKLSPAVLIDSSGSGVTLRFAAAPKYIAWVASGQVTARTLDKESVFEVGDVDLSEPWLLVWFGDSTPVRAYARKHDVESELGVHKGPDGYDRPPDAVDLPILIRLEHKPKTISANGVNLALQFRDRAGKLAIMPLAGNRIFLPEETENWKDALPENVLSRCRLWSANLRDWPVSVDESFSFDQADKTVGVKQRFTWASFADDWKSPVVKAAPVAPMLALAAERSGPVSFFCEGREVQPTPLGFMDTPGAVAVIRGVDEYEYSIDIKELMKRSEPSAIAACEEVTELKQRLERHVEQMVDAGALRPLLYIYGGIGGTWFSHFYWGSSAELADALAEAAPYLSKPLQEKAVRYLKDEWRANPPLKFNRNRYMMGKLRSPYEFPWPEMERHVSYALGREAECRQADQLFEFYGVDAYLKLTGESPTAEMRSRATEVVREMLGAQDWAIMGPARLRTARDRHSGLYYNLQGEATYNRWLAGAVGIARIAQRFGWTEERQLACYLAAKLAVARIAQCHYVSALYDYGVVRGELKDDNRALLHIDTTCAVIGRGPLEMGVHQNQEIPPFNDLTEPVGRLLGQYAQNQCRRYLDHLDYSMPLWYISEAPKQSATEHRTTPLQYYSGNVLAQYWTLGKTKGDFARYVDTTRFIGDLYYIRNLAAAIESYGGDGGK